MKKIRCDFCGETIDKNDTFCKSCGNAIKNKEIKDAIIDDPNKKNNNLNNNFIMYIIIVLLLIIAIGLLL